ncbi:MULTISPECIES: SsrA-binding protein SmpB [Carnobacterium]|uniref:SsrA-binding protein n=2 Tax=Carnobacterium divergens TaxID=2748 RepID=A0A0R2HXR2_CARDV|nr:MULTISPECIES: SsrA-binding protein SmpB [Carnobacterium]ANZ99304.1 SsrA-binding protein [Carnobacterium divergens]KRN57227.1 SsrA-binding protein [Carnobacterium divergens DSM 20623]MCO6018500.1 SsrA-binding protein SmpB [Carnobacterium divergens]MDO0875684.1 SsrA-binding protein SmpB [Carnobacterium divergens]MDT1939852.1 SsrA-binding protein SmpB [Carnobacterium divergens]
MPKGDGKLVAQNRKARHDYSIIDTVEAGMVLQGTEIKSVRGARINLKDGYAKIQNGEIYLHNVHISPYEQGNQFNHDPLRVRKLLMHKKQILRLLNETKATGNTLIPLKVYIKDGYAKVLIGLAKGKKNYDKREDLKRKDMKRETDRMMRIK